MGIPSSAIVGVILAAGKGSRMTQLPTKLPKVALPILDKPVVYHQLRMMAQLGIREAVIVVGYRGFEVVRQIERLPDTGVAIDYVHQEESLGIAHCVGCLENRIDKPFFLFLGDVYFHAPRIGEMVEAFSEPGVDAVLSVVEEEDDAQIAKNYCVVTGAGGRVTHVVEKPRHPKSRLKGAGVYLFSPVVFDAIRRTPRTAMRNEYEITDSIQILINDGYQVRASACIARDMNLTYAADLLAANLWALEKEGVSRYVAPDAEVGEGVALESAVVGSRAQIGKGASLRNVVVFAQGTVPEGRSLDGAIVTESEVLRL